MKSSLHFLFGLLCLLPAIHGQTPTRKTLGTVATDWLGVSFDLTQIVRLGPEYILVAVQVRGDATVKNPTMICGPVEPSQKDPNAIKPFTLVQANLVDQGTGKEYRADGKLPAQPYWGDPDIISNIRPNTWFQLAVRFQVPPPLPPAPDGKIPEQKVTFQLPRAKGPIKDIVLPLPPAH